MGVGKIEYNDIIFEFDRAWNIFTPERLNIITTNLADSGIEEDNEFYERYFIDVLRNSLKPNEVIELERWYEYVKDGSSFKLWRDKDVYQFWGFEGKSTNDNDENAVTSFTRTGVANNIDPYTGLVTSVAENTARFESGKFGDTSGALLIEDAITNILTDTEDFDLAGDWDSAHVSVTTNQAIAPDGNLTADKLDGGIDQTIYNVNTATVIGTNDGCGSIWLRCTTETETVKIQLVDHILTLLAEESVTVTTSWQRFHVGYDNPGTSGNNWGFQIKFTENATIVYAWGAQIEVGTRYPTSYITGEATRNTETLYVTLDSDRLDLEEFTISAWIKVPWDNTDLELNNTDRYITMFTISGAADAPPNNQALALYMYGTLSPSPVTFVEIKVNNYENDQFRGIVASSAFSADTWIYVAVTCICNHTTTTCSINVYVDGVLIDSSTDTNFIPSAFDRCYIGSAGWTGTHLDGLIDDFFIENKAISAGEVAARYNSGKSRGIRKNYFPAVKLVEPSFKPIQQVGAHRYNFQAKFKEELT